MTTETKPAKRTMENYNYHECRDWLQEKYGYDERNVARKTFGGDNDEAPYQDFWHFVIDRAGNVHNGSVVCMYEEWKDGAEPWQAEIIDRYLEHFGEGKDGNRAASFWVEW